MLLPCDINKLCDVMLNSVIHKCPLVILVAWSCYVTVVASFKLPFQVWGASWVLGW